MPDVSDMDLVREYTAHNSEPAFAELAHRHINLVYSVALRYTGNAEDAQDVTQAVFIILAKKAASLRERNILTGWLYETTRFTAARLLRTTARRHAREQEAFMQSTLNESNPDSVWRQLAPHLEAAMARLGERDRTLLALRFFENKSGAEAAAALGIREDAAHKRTARAVEKLRTLFRQRGIVLSTVAITGAVSAHSVQAAPAELAATVSAATVKGATISATITALVKGTMKMMTWLKIKFAVGVGTAVILAGGVTTIALSGDGRAGAVGLAASAFQMRIVLDKASADSEPLVSSTTNTEGRVFQETLNVQKRVLLDQSAIQSTLVSTNPFGGRQIDFVLTPKGREQFAKVTRENIGRRLAIVIDGKVITAPVIRAEISGGRGVISGSFTEAEAKALAARISKAAKN